MTSAQIALPKVLIPVFTGRADVRGAYGGRGSGKTRSFAKMAAVEGYRHGSAGTSGIILCARQFMNSLEDSSLEECKRAIADEPFLAAYYDVGDKYIRSRDGRISFSFAGLDRNISSIKSMGRLLLCWVDEAEPVTDEAWTTLIPTLREEGEDWSAELWVTWNPKRKNAAVETRFRASTDPLIKIVSCNWRDNPKFPEKLERDRLRDLAERPDQYDHVWEGAYATVVEGAYFASHLTAARASGRIGRVPADPLMINRVFVDIGGTGARADAFTMWVAQFIGLEIRVLDYYEAVGQPLATHLEWLRERKYEPAGTKIWLPHDGSQQDKVHDTSYEKAFKAAGYDVEVVPNQGKGAAKSRIEAARRLFPSIWFNEDTTEAGRDALGWYHEKRDEKRNIGLGPAHDWASHACFVGSTKVLTRYGLRQIMDLPETGEVLTPCGWKQYINPRMTKSGAPLVEVVFTDGYSVRCTPDHLFLTVCGWKSAESLTPTTEIQSTLTKSRSTSTEGSIGYGPVNDIRLGAEGAFTETRGARRLVQFLMGAISIIGTGIRLTIASTIWSASRRKNTCLQLGMQARGALIPAISTSLQRQEPKLVSGTSLRRAGFGTSVTQSGRRAGHCGSARTSPVNTVVESSLRLFARVAMPASIAKWLAKWRHIENAEKQTNTPLLIERVRHLSQRADVWDITVPDGRWFSLENGAVVHNSDSFGLLCIVYEPPRALKPLPARRRGFVV